MSNLKVFIQGYIECALRATIGEPDDGENNGDPLNILDVTDSARKQVESECKDFLKREDVSPITEKWGIEEYRRAGHDFFLTRNHHGAGFWDGDWPESDAKILTKASHEAGSSEPYVGDDGEIYFS